MWWQSKKIQSMSASQRVLLESYRAKELDLARSTERLDPRRAIAAIEALFQLQNKPMPQIEICTGPYDAAQRIQSWMLDNPGGPAPEADGPYCRLSERYNHQITGLRDTKVFKQLQRSLDRQLQRGLSGDLWTTLQRYWLGDSPLRVSFDEWELGPWSEYRFYPSWYLDLHQASSVAASRACLYDFVVNGLGLSGVQRSYNADFLQVYLWLANSCGWVFFYQDMCLICDRPVQVKLDWAQRLHAQGEAAIAFGDGYSCQVNHGIVVPPHLEAEFALSPPVGYPVARVGGEAAALGHTNHAPLEQLSEEDLALELFVYEGV